MPNRPSLQRGGVREAAVLEALRNGATRTAAGAAGGVSRRTFFRHMERSAAFAHDVALAEDEAERRMTGVVFEAAAAGDVKAAMFWLERRRPADYRLQTQTTLDGRMAMEQEYSPEMLALVRRYAGLTTDEIEAELQRLDWVVPATEQPGKGDAAPTPGAGPEGQAAVGDGVAILPLPGAPTDETAETAERPAIGTHQPEPEATARLGPPQPAEPLPPFVPSKACPHCEGDLRHHQPACPVFYEDGRLRIPWAAGGDPR